MRRLESEHINPKVYKEIIDPSLEGIPYEALYPTELPMPLSLLQEMLKTIRPLQPAEEKKILNLTNALNRDHMRQLARTLRPDGLVHFADAFSFTNAEETKKEIDAIKLMPVRDRYFNTYPEDSWEWKPNENPFQVHAFTQIPRK